MEDSGPRARLWDWLWFLAWGVASSVWCVTAAGQLGATFDEPIYVQRGLECWRTGSHAGIVRLGTMPLPVDVVTLPLYLWERWHGVLLDPVDHLDELLPWARAGTLLFWWLLLAYGRLAGRELAGPWGGRAVVAALACEPNLLAHAGLATTDVAVSACLLALVYHFHTGREAGWLRRVGLPMFWFGAAVLAKASGLVFGGLCLLAVELERLLRTGAFSDPVTGRRWAGLRHAWRQLRPFRRDLHPIVWGGLLLTFAYCGSDWKVEPSFVAWAHSLPDGPGDRAVVWVAEHLRIFCNAGEGLARQVKHNIHGQSVYLLGRWDYRAIWYYFPVALSIKLCVPLLLAPLLLALVRPRTLGNWACVTAAVLLVFSLTCRVQIGIRLVLPLIVLAVVGLTSAAVQACQAAAPGWRRRLLTAGAAAGVVWTAAAALMVWPHGLSYVNELWGGTKRGYRHISESNYDWGQGLRGLARWQQSHADCPLDLWYFGTDPAWKTMPVRHIMMHLWPLQRPEDVLAFSGGRRLAVSASLLYGPPVTENHEIATAFLRTRRPAARTMTFFIYDFTHEPPPPAAVAVRPSGQRGAGE
jgi:hypothetical protein